MFHRFAAPEAGSLAGRRDQAGAGGRWRTGPTRAAVHRARQWPAHGGVVERAWRTSTIQVWHRSRHGDVRACPDRTPAPSAGTEAFGQSALYLNPAAQRQAAGSYNATMRDSRWPVRGCATVWTASAALALGGCVGDAAPWLFGSVALLLCTGAAAAVGWLVGRHGLRRDVHASAAGGASARRAGRRHKSGSRAGSRHGSTTGAPSTRSTTAERAAPSLRRSWAATRLLVPACWRAATTRCRWC
jgi:hypothetical protein